VTDYFYTDLLFVASVAGRTSAFCDCTGIQPVTEPNIAVFSRCSWLPHSMERWSAYLSLRYQSCRLYVILLLKWRTARTMCLVY